MPIVGTIGAAAAAGAATAAKGTGIWAGLKAGALAVGKFLGNNAAIIGTSAAVTGTALAGGSFSNGNLKVSFKKGLLDKRNSDSSHKSNAAPSSSHQSKQHRSNSAYNQSKKQSWSHSGTYKKRG